MDVEEIGTSHHSISKLQYIEILIPHLIAPYVQLIRNKIKPLTVVLDFTAQFYQTRWKTNIVEIYEERTSMYEKN